MTHRTFLVIGGGIGGLSAAIALRQRGFEVTVLERSADLHSSIHGVGIIQPGNALRALDAIGCADACVAVCYPAKQWGRMLDVEGESHFFNNMTMITDGHFNLQHNMPVATYYDDVVQLMSHAQVSHTPTLVVLFGEDTPMELIGTLRPDVLVKGADYTIEQVVGGDLVQGWGGRVVLVNLAEGHSTTGTIRRMTAPAAAE